MYTIGLTNFGYDYPGTYSTLGEAITKAKDIGFDCSITHKLDDGSSKLVASVNPINGTVYMSNGDSLTVHW